MIKMVIVNKIDNRIGRKFYDLKQRKQSALICYIVAGYPDVITSEEIIKTLVKAGADIIEIGIPFSDPIADGPSIQEASHHALTHGVTPQQCVALAETVRKKFPDLPLIFMTYSNILFRIGFEHFMTRARISGIDGFILPDMSIEESKEYLRISRELGLASIFIVSPNTEKKRARRIMNVSTGFLYVISVYGVTGVRNTLSDHSIRRIIELRKIANPILPIAVGFGVQNRDHVTMMVNAGADGVIVGSALINIIRESGAKREMLDNLYDFVCEMKDACRHL
jgi:tryptophan synthase alpha chain